MSNVLDLHFVYKVKAELQPRLPMALVIEPCSPLTSLFSGFPGFITTGLSKFVNDSEGTATQGENNGSSSWVTIWAVGILLRLSGILGYCIVIFTLKI